MTDAEVIALAVALLWLARRAPGPTGASWTWPVPVWVTPEQRIKPQISSDYQGGKHRGVDILYHIKAPGWHWTAPVGTPILAASSGTVETVGRTPRGIAVLIDHGDRRFKTFYQHLETADVLRGQHVSAGQRLGTMGIDPLDAEQVRHLHFEVWGWDTGAAIDPVKEMSTWKMVAWTP